MLIWLGQGWYKTTTFGAAYEGPLVKAELDVLRMVMGSRNEDRRIMVRT